MIDGHAHACGRLLTARGIETYLNENQISKIVLCGGEPGSRRNYPYPLLSDIWREDRVAAFINTMIKSAVGFGGYVSHLDSENLRVHKLSRELAGRVLPAYWINPLEAGCIEKMNAFYRQYSFSMIKLHQCWTAFDVASENCGRLFAWAGAHKKPVFIHLSGREQARRLAAMANRFARTNIIAAHLLWAKEIYPLLKHNNIWYDLSSPQLYTIETLKAVLAACGAGRLILGSDTPYGNHNIPAILKRLEQLSVSGAQKDLVAGQNLSYLLGRKDSEMLDEKTEQE